jgi:hypothetical protein
VTRSSDSHEIDLRLGGAMRKLDASPFDDKLARKIFYALRKQRVIQDGDAEAMVAGILS